MLREPDQTRIAEIAESPEQAIAGPKARLQKMLERLDLLEKEFHAHLKENEYGVPRLFHGFDNPEEYGEWVKRTLRLYAEIRDTAGQASRDLVVYSLREQDGNEALVPNQLAKAAKIGNATVYRWRDAGVRESGE